MHSHHVSGSLAACTLLVSQCLHLTSQLVHVLLLDIFRGVLAIEEFLRTNIPWRVVNLWSSLCSSD